MKTTNLFVELVIIGIGFTMVIALAFFCLEILDKETIEQISKVESIVLLPILLTIAYTLGIVADRMADRLFTFPRKKVRNMFYAHRVNILRDKSLLFTTSNPLVDMILYGRSRMRICRGYVLNLVLLIPFLNWFLFKLDTVPTTYLITNVFLIIFIFLFYFSWQMLVKGEYEKLIELSKIQRRRRK